MLEASLISIRTMQFILESSSFLLLFKNDFFLRFIYFWMHRVLVVARGLLSS